jgi:ketosteroid isomerase-like protein
MTAVLDRFYQALGQLSAPGLAPCVCAGFVLDWPGTPSIPWAGRWEGVEGLLAFVAKLDEHLEILDVQRTHVLERDGVTAVVLQGHWRIKRNGREVRATAVNLFTFEQDRVKSYTVLNNTAAFAEALAA